MTELLQTWGSFYANHAAVATLVAFSVLWGAERRALSGNHAAWRRLRLSAIASLALWFLTPLGGVALSNLG
jgi:hypothetical protein